MSLDNAHLTQFQREPLWAIGLTALLVATGLTRRPVGRFPNRSGDAQLDAGVAALQRGHQRFRRVVGKTFFGASMTAYPRAVSWPTLQA